ncbi:MAG: sugar transporter [Oceanococcus sp.]|nr:MAG: sugar transporter [Oceanococcus sp.]
MIERFFSPAMRMKRYLALVLGPTALALLYLGLIASDGYVSRASFLIEQDSPSMSGGDMALSLLNLGGGPSRQDTLVVDAFLRSRTLLEQMQSSLDLRGHFSSDERDLFSRMDAEASQEDFLEFYRKHLHTLVDEESQIMTVEFTAHDPEYAHKVVSELVRQGEQFVNKINQSLAEEQLTFITAEVDKAATRLRQATVEMLALQRKNDVLNPQQETAAVAQILAGLEAELTRQQTELKALSGYLNPSAPDIVATKQRIDALQAQVAEERRRMVGEGRDEFSKLMLDYQNAEVNLRIAGELYKSALTSLETTRLDAVRKAKYVIPVDRANVPDSAELPRVGYWTVTVFVLLNLMYFVSGLIVATIQDHRE